MESGISVDLPDERLGLEPGYATHASLQIFEMELSTAYDVERGLDALERLAEELGYRTISYSRRTSPNAVPRQSWFRHFPAGWDDHWARYSRSDPFLRTSFSNNLPFSWDEIETSPDHPLEVYAVRHLRRYGLEHGITAPVHHGDGAVSTVTLICAPTDDRHQARISRTRNVILLATHLFVSRVENLLANCASKTERKADTFNTREQECLHWASLGKTTGEMATIMGISDNTIKVYFRRIFTRLEVRTRPQAISEAKRRGLLQ